MLKKRDINHVGAEDPLLIQKYVCSASFPSQSSSSRKVVLCTNTVNLTALLSHLEEKKHQALRIQVCSVSMSLKRAFAFSTVLQFLC